MYDKISQLEDAVRALLETADEHLRSQPYATTNDIMRWEEARRKADNALQPPIRYFADKDDTWRVIRTAMYLEGLDKVSVQFSNFDIMTVDTVWLWSDRPGRPVWKEMRVAGDGSRLEVPSVVRGRKEYTLHTTLRDLEDIEQRYGDVAITHATHGPLGNCAEGTFEWLERVGIETAGRTSIRLAELVEGFRQEPRREVLLVIRHFVRLNQGEEDEKAVPGSVQEITGDMIRWAVSCPLWAVYRS